MILGAMNELLAGNTVSYCDFWKDPRPFFYPQYLKYSPILPYLNNEVPHEKSVFFKHNFLGLHKLVLVGGPDDNMIKPWQTTKFGFFDDKLNAVEMKDYFLYKLDTFGLKTLDERNNLTLCTVLSMPHTFFHLSHRVYKNCVKPHVG